LLVRFSPGVVRRRPGYHSGIEQADRVPACQVVQVEGGKVKSASHYFDMFTLLTQIGATKSAALHQSAA
jgi:hypothetical protein